jgi:adhesin HecA-like repeat protein
MGADTVSMGGQQLTLSAARLDLNPGGVASPAEATASPEDESDPV